VSVELDESTPSSMGVAKLDDAKAATTVTTIADDKRTVSEEVI
jgi:hypothetical protein